MQNIEVIACFGFKGLRPVNQFIKDSGDKRMPGFRCKSVVR